MKLIYDKRDSGKARRIFELAKETGAVILTENARALRVKAKGYGYGDELQIMDIMGEYNLEENNAICSSRKIIFHNLDKILNNYFNNYAIEVIGATMTEEE